MPAVIAYTLPTMQLVWYLVVLGTFGIIVTNPATTLQLPPHYQVTPLPDGYVVYPDVIFAYKYHSTPLDWINAQNVCIQEGARLAVIDSPQKMEYFARHATADTMLAGVIRMNNDTWTNVNTGEPVAEEVHNPGGPSTESYNCALFLAYPPKGLYNWSCREQQAFFCEIRILVNSTETVN